MKRTLILAVAALLVSVGCNKIETSSSEAKKVELSIMPMTGNVATRGYTQKSEFQFQEFDQFGRMVKDTLRDMNISAYLYPQDGEPRNYFVNKLFRKAPDGDFWRNGGVPSMNNTIFWPVGGKLDFLAYSSTEGGLTASWNEDNAASQVVIDVPAECSQDDILFASACGKENIMPAAPVSMIFKHAQAWLTFAISASEGPEHASIVHLNRIELEDVYNGGVLKINSNNGDALANWDFSAETRQNVEVDNKWSVSELNIKYQVLQMLIPQQEKTAFVIYYTLGDSTNELSYRFTTDQKTWLMGEHYIYTIQISANEVTVNPIVTAWDDGDVADINAQTDHGVIY